MTHQQGTCTSRDRPFSRRRDDAEQKASRHAATRSTSSVREHYVIAARCPRTPLSLSHAWADTDHATVTPRRRAAVARELRATAAAVLPVIPTTGSTTGSTTGNTAHHFSLPGIRPVILRNTAGALKARVASSVSKEPENTPEIRTIANDRCFGLQPPGPWCSLLRPGRARIRASASTVPCLRRQALLVPPTPDSRHGSLGLADDVGLNIGPDSRSAAAAASLVASLTVSPCRTTKPGRFWLCLVNRSTHTRFPETSTQKAS